ncbi:MAG: MarR family winged helix-turn-helix transcriptional regulator [Minisyncoccia bacterium]
MPYLSVVNLVELVSFTLRELIKLELKGLHIEDINHTQALLLVNLGEAEMTVGELTLRGCYVGSNASYNVKEMVENGYLNYINSTHDRRAVLVKLTAKGHRLRNRLVKVLECHASELWKAGIDDNYFKAMTGHLDRFSRALNHLSDVVARSSNLRVV